MAKCENCDNVHWQPQQSSVQVYEPETGVEKVKRKWLQRTGPSSVSLVFRVTFWTQRCVQAPGGSLGGRRSGRQLACSYQSISHSTRSQLAQLAQLSHAQALAHSGPARGEAGRAVPRPARKHRNGAPAILPVPLELVRWAPVCFRAAPRGRRTHVARLVEARGLSMGPGHLLV